MRWNKNNYQVTAPLDDRKHQNVRVMRSVTGIKNYITSCAAFDQEFDTLAYPAPISMDKSAEQVM
jgi:hypothetical protein